MEAEHVTIHEYAKARLKFFTFKRYPDGCYAVVSGNRRGPCAHDKPTALTRFWRSGFIDYVGTGV